MKKKLLSLLILLCFVSTPVVEAGRKVTGYTETPNHFKGDNDYHAGSSTKITMEGGYSAYCIDPGRVTATNNATCNESTVDGAHGAGYATIMSSDADEDTKGLAMRIYATATGDNRFQNSSSKDAINTKCGYVRAANLAADKAGTQIVDELKTAKSHGGTNCANDFSLYTEGEDNKVTSDAINLASEALKTSNSAEGGAVGYNAPSCSAKSSKGKVTISCSNVPEGSSLSVSGAISGGGAVPAGSFTQEFDVDCSGSEKKYSAELIYNAEAGQCSEVVSYSCTGLGKDAQKYMGCNQESDGSGQTKLPIATNEEASCGDPTDPGDPSEEECPVEPSVTNQLYNAAANGLCTSDGQVVLEVSEDAYATKENVDACIIDELDYAGSDLEATRSIIGDSNPYCEIYCAESYEFKSPGKLSSADYDGDRYIITSGSYFNFEKEYAYDSTNVSCFGVNKIELLRNTVKGLADTYANKFSQTEITCTPHEEELDDGTTVTKWTRVTYSHGYSAQWNASNEYKIQFKKETTISGIEYDLDTCTTQDPTYTRPESERATATENYRTEVNEQVELFRECNKWDFGKLEDSIKGGCHADVIFDYTDGIWLDIDDVKLDAEVQPANGSSKKAKTFKSTTSKYKDATESATTIPFDLGDAVGGVPDAGESNEFINADFTSNEITFDINYKINPIGICNDYNSGQAEYGISESECLSEPGRTYTTGWPISYDTTQGKYEYRFIVSNFGHYLDDSCDPGRLQNVAEEKGVDSFELVCPYEVNGCDDCLWGCDPDGICGGEDPECDDECIWECRKVGCIFDIQNGLAVDFEPISLKNPFLAANIKYLNDMHNNALAYNVNNKQTEQEEKNNDANAVVAVGTPNKNGLAANWRTEKGSAALDAIEGLGEEAYTGEHLEYRITLSPRDINIIRDYNSSNEVQNNGGYLNNTLNCVNNDPRTTTNPDGTDYVTCTSGFLDDLTGTLNKDEIASTNTENVDESTIINNMDAQSPEERKTTSKGKKSGEGPAFR